jgi:sugar transferase EpsL
MKFAWKRILDVCLALAGGIICAPLMIIIGLMVWLTMGRPVLFLQERTGYKGRLFRIVKFRTMNQPSDKRKHLDTDAERLTFLGKWLRQLSLDELPEVWNVLRGEMSIVGPRPLLPEYLERYSREQARRHDVYPGITGWAQVNGRNGLSWEERFVLDTWYVDNWSFLLDLKIVLKTFYQVACRKEINRPGHATMPEFLGNGKETD